jgi:ribosomal protein S14
MPAVAVPAVPSALAESQSVRRPVRLVRAGRACPVCGERRCSAPTECANEYANRSWTECADCGGSGYDTTGFDIWCRVCVGTCVVEV